MTMLTETAALQIAECFESQPEPPNLDMRDSIWSTGYGPDGRRTFSMLTTSFDTHEDHRIMFAALELTRAIRRGVAITPERFFELVVRPPKLGPTDPSAPGARHDDKH